MHLTVPDVDAVYARAVSAGVEIDHPPQDEPYGARSFGMIDPYGHRWMIQTPIATPTTDEIEAAMDGYTITTSGATAPAAAGSGPVVELGYFTLGVPDTARAGRFYGALFGWETRPGNLGDEYAHVENTALPLGLTPGAAADAPVLYFRVDDVTRYAARVRELGGEVVEETTYESGPNAVCRDDQGREFQLWQPAPGYE
jgi:predicted enzyme related to lactoylglutathione lyase